MAGEKLPPRQIAPGKLPLKRENLARGELPPRKIAPWKNPPLGKLPPGKFPPAWSYLLFSIWALNLNVKKL